MSNFFYGAAHPAAHQSLATQALPHHVGRRRAARSSNHQHGGQANHHQLQHHHQYQKQTRQVRTPKDLQESTLDKAFRRDFDAARSFDIDDDELFCPFHLLTEDDLQSISSAGSDRSSLSSGSPEQSPMQHQVQPSSSFLLPPSTANFVPSYQSVTSAPHQPKLHQPLAQRSRNAIPIVDPSTRAVASPPQSASPARQMQHQFISNRRW